MKKGQFGSPKQYDTFMYPRMSEALKRRIRDDAKRREISDSEWIRLAAEKFLRSAR